MSREIYTREGDATLRRTLLTPSSYRMNARGIKMFWGYSGVDVVTVPGLSSVGRAFDCSSIKAKA